MATTVNPYADRATAQMMAAQQPANLFAQQKQTAYPDAVQRRVPGQVVGETPEQFAAARQAANSQGSGYNAQPLMQQPSVQSQPSAVQTPRTVGAGSQYQNTRTSISNADELARAMGYTSPEEEERLRKASVANQRIMAVADAIRHIGNIANTVNGAPSMQFNNPVKDEYDRYLKGKALRDAANYKYLSYQQQKAAQDAKIRQWEAEQKYKRDKDERDFRFNAAKTAADLAEKKRQYDQNYKFNEQKWKETSDLNERKFKKDSAYKDRMAGIAAGRLGLSREEFNYKKENGYYGRGATKTATGRGNGYTYSTRRGSVTIPADYLSKNKINKRSLLTAMERAGAIDTEWLDNYDRAIWNEKQQEQMLDDAVSNWLMTDDAAEDYMVKHLKGQSSWTESNSKSNPYGDNSGKWKSGNHKSNPYG
jgi:hypothetical protein